MKEQKDINQLIVIILVAIAFVVPVLWQTKNLSLRLDTDYDAMLPTLSYLSSYVHQYKEFPRWNPYVGTGIPVVGDPVSPALNPTISVPVILFGAENGVRVILFFNVIFSGLFMWMFLTRIGVGGIARLWGSTLYEISGMQAALFVSGHSLAPYAYIPLFLLFATPDSLKKIELVGSAAVVAFILYQGDFYQTFFACLLFIAIRCYWAVTRGNIRLSLRHSVIFFVIFLVLSSYKLIPFLIDVRPTLQRFFPIDPYAGSIHFFWVPLSFIIPFQMSFYDRPFFQRLFGFHYNWYEYFAFISPVSFVFLTKIRRVMKTPYIKVLLVLIVVCLLYIALRYPYSPFYWLFHVVAPVRAFRTPQRILISMTSIVVAVLAVCAHWWMTHTKNPKQKAIVIGSMLISVVWTFWVSNTILYQAFEPFRSQESLLARELRTRDASNFYVATFVCCVQTFLVEQKVPILNYYYAWRTKDTPNFINSNGNGFDYSVLANVRPTYVIAPRALNLETYSYYLFFVSPIAGVWKTDYPTIVPKRL